MIESLENESIKKWNDFSKLVVDQLNQTLANPSEDFDKEINRVIKRLIKISTRKLDNTPESQKLFFDETCNFLNSVFGSVQIKKFYNTAPIKSFREYADMSLWKEAINNIYGKERKLFYKEQIWGWSCHHRTIFLKKLFDKLEKKWLDIKSRILLYSNIWWHSLVGIQFQGKLYIADVSGVNSKVNRIISQLDQLPKEFSKHFAHFSFNKKHDKDGKILYFDELNDFVDDISNKPIKNISLEFKPKLQDREATDISLSINKTWVILDVDWKGKTFLLPKNFIIPSNINTTHKILDYIFHNISWDKICKTELQQYFSIVVSKINPDKLKSIFSIN